MGVDSVRQLVVSATGATSSAGEPEPGLIRLVGVDGVAPPEPCDVSATSAVLQGAALQDLIAPSLALAYALLRDRTEAEDAVQEALLRAWRKRLQFQDRGSGPRSWILTIVANECRDRLRSRWWHVGRHADLTVIDAERGAESRAVFRVDLERALRQLTPPQHAALLLTYQMDLSQAEIAEILGIRVGTVKSRVNRALTILRAAMQEEQEEEHRGSE